MQNHWIENYKGALTDDRDVNQVAKVNIWYRLIFLRVTKNLLIKWAQPLSGSILFVLVEPFEQQKRIFGIFMSFCGLIDKIYATFMKINL